MAIQVPQFEIEKELLAINNEMLVGVDEVGRGPLCGPVIAAAAVSKASDFSQIDFSLKEWSLVRDSKTLSEKQRERAFDFIKEHFIVGVGLCNHETIDRINILEASFLAMKKAVQNLLKEIPDELRKQEFCILVDGNKQIPNFSMKQKAIVGGDGSVSLIAAASIIAKVTRDRLMQEIHEKYPQYGFDKHKGYGTKLHLDMLKLYGPCEIHRKSFGPVKKCLK